MPHKHTRKEKDLSTFDLPPTQVAKPLPVTSISKRKAPPPPKRANDDPKKSKLKRKRGDGGQDDVPRSFKRLMAFAGGNKTRSGLDNGEGPEKKGKSKAQKKAAAAAANAVSEATEVTKAEPNPDLTIRPGERMWEFSQRVDAALPLSGLVNKTVRNGKDPLGLKVKRTKKERRMHKMYDEWREQDKKLKEQREEELEEEEEKAMEADGMGVTWKLDMEEAAKGKKQKKGKRARLIGEDNGKEEDPWKEIIKKRGEAKAGLHDVAHAPPELTKLAKNKLLVRNGAGVAVDNIPKAVGSLRQREELQGIRDEVVAGYRKLMSERRPAAKEKAATSS